MNKFPAPRPIDFRPIFGEINIYESACRFFFAEILKSKKAFLPVMWNDNNEKFFNFPKKNGP